MNGMQSWVEIYLLNSLWQIPLVFAAAWIAARLLRPVSSHAEHRIWASAILAEVILPACQFDGNSIGRSVLAFVSSALARSGPSGSVQLVFKPGAVADPAAFHLPGALLNGILITYAISIVYFVLRLGWGCWRTSLMLRDSEPIEAVRDLGRLNDVAQRLFVVGEALHYAESPIASGPVTLGIRRAVLLFPKGFLRGVAAADLEVVLAHELAHVRRRDFAKNLFYSLASLPVAYHPLLWLTASSLAATREMVCDAMAGDCVHTRERYAQSLLRLAAMLSDRMPVKTLHAIGIFDANVFERRIMRLTQKRKHIGTTRRFAMVTLAAIVGLAACTSAIALGIRVLPVSTSTAEINPETVHVNQNNMKVTTRVNPIYPIEAKKSGIEGTVVLQAVINKEGVPEQLKVMSGPKELQKSSLDAVRQWRWEPYLLNGDPVDVDTTINITFSLKG
jgi:TonB family protein